MKLTFSKISGWAKSFRWLPVLLPVWLVPGAALAQAMPEPPSRWLLVFDTSRTMERWLPGTTTELQNILFNSMSGELHAGDSIGVWTFDEKLRVGKFPLLTWQPAKAASDSADLVNFLDYEHYSGSTKFDSLRPLLRQVIAHSLRLTVVIFCDGKDRLKLTPYDDSINQTFQAAQGDRKKAKVPFVLVLRTQAGHFVGATVNLPPGALDFPAFPPLPVVPEPPSVNVSAAPALASPAPAVTAPPLVIVGTKVVTNQDEIKKLSGP